MTKFSILKNQSVINYIFDFLNYQDLSIARNLDKKSRNIISKYQKYFIKYLNIIRQLSEKKILTIEDLARDANFLYEVFEVEENFHQIFNNLFHKEIYKFDFDFDELIEHEREIRKTEYEIVLRGLKKNNEVNEIFINNLESLEKKERDINYGKIIEIIKINNSINYFYLGFNCLGLYPEYIKHLSEALKINKLITNINIYFNNLGSNPENFKDLAEGLIYNKSITIINLNNNNIGSNPQNIKYLSEGLKQNKSINYILLNSNNIGSNPENMQHFAEVFKYNKYIIYIDLRQNQINYYHENIKIISDIQEKNKYLTIEY